LIGTLPNIKDKTKNVVNCDLNLIKMNTLEELAPKQIAKCTYLLATCYILSKNDKITFVKYVI